MAGYRHHAESWVAALRGPCSRTTCAAIPSSERTACEAGDDQEKVTGFCTLGPDFSLAPSHALLPLDSFCYLDTSLLATTFLIDTLFIIHHLPCLQRVCVWSFQSENPGAGVGVRGCAVGVLFVQRGVRRDVGNDEHLCFAATGDHPFLLVLSAPLVPPQNTLFSFQSLLLRGLFPTDNLSCPASRRRRGRSTPQLPMGSPPSPQAAFTRDQPRKLRLRPSGRTPLRAAFKKERISRRSKFMPK